MLKFTSLVLGVITVIAIVPSAQAATTINPLSLDRSVNNLHAQVILLTGRPVAPSGLLGKLSFKRYIRFLMV